MILPYGTRQIFELECKECAWWEGSGSGLLDDSMFGEQVGPCANPSALNGMPPFFSAQNGCPGFEPRQAPDYSEDDVEEVMWGSSSEILDLATAINLIEEGRIERPGKDACANLPFQIVTAEGIAFLSQYAYHSINLAVTDLTRPISEVLSKWGISVIRFMNPVALDPDGFEPFRFSDIEFYFWGGVTGLSIAVARILATCTGSLMLHGINITKEVAEVLSHCKAGASLSLIGEHSHEVLHHLAQYQGERLLLTFDTPLDDSAMDALCSNPKRSMECLERDDCETFFQVLSVLKPITFIPPDLEQAPCGVTVGVVAGSLEIDRVAESFRGLLDVLPISGSDNSVGCEAVFRQCENRQEVEILLPLGGDQHREHRIMVSVVASPFSALDSVVHAVLAPAFAPGGVGVDWEDICLILRSGKRAILVMAESDEAVTDTLRLAESGLAAGDQTRISGVMAAVFAPHGATWMEPVRQVRRAAETLAPDAWRLVAAPIILGDTPVCAVLAVFPK